MSKTIIDYFKYLSSVPHGSGNTKAISNLCVDFAIEHNLKYYQDDINNVIIYKDAAPGYENAAPVILQGHLDMVCVKTEDNPIDMSKTPITIIEEGDWLYADKTSLGGDNIIAVASILNILANDVKAPAIEAVFTVDEETGMFGAAALDTTKLKGRKLINLDSEEEGVFTTGCCGGARFNCDLKVTRESDLFDYTFFEICIDGLLGGHSGCDIDKERGMSHRLMGRMLYEAYKELDIRLIKFEGGKFDNVIPQKTLAKIAVLKDRSSALIELLSKYNEIFKAELRISDPDVNVSVGSSSNSEDYVCKQDTEKILKLLNILPYGIQNMSSDIKGLVQTSLNMGVVMLSSEAFHFSYSVRSNVGSQKEELLSRLVTIVDLFGADYNIAGNYPAWEFAPVSELRDICERVYKEYTGKDAFITATHGGLECGLLIDKMPGLDAVSFGPDLRDVHSVNEKLNIPSVYRMYDIVLKVLENCR